MSVLMNAATSRVGLSKEEKVSGWILDLAELHDPQPDKPYVILGRLFFELA